MLPNFSELIKRPILFLALGLGSGLAPKAPGTFGTLAAVPLFLLLPAMSPWVYGVFLVVTFIIGIYFCQKAADDLGVHDHPAIVLDEFVGLWISLFPVIVLGFAWYWLILGFALFRFFDILKPWPIHWFDRHVHGGLGIMLDDVIAGIEAALVLGLVMSMWG